MNKQYSVWGVTGTPKTETGLYGAHRSALMLLELDSIASDAFAKFIEECNDTDGGAYTQGDFDCVKYLGWVKVKV